MKKREDEIMSITSGDERWENWLQFTQSQLVPKFTKYGFKIIQTPPAIHAKLYEAVNKAVANFDSIPSEGNIDVIYNPPLLAPKFVPLYGLDREVINEMKELHEEWGGMKLKATSSYGVRLYQNGSSLVMHYDKIHTHVISSIVHIAHEYDDDNEPWPIEIEDHDGKNYLLLLKNNIKIINIFISTHL